MKGLVIIVICLATLLLLFPYDQISDEEQQFIGILFDFTFRFHPDLQAQLSIRRRVQTQTPGLYKKPNKNGRTPH